MGEEREGTRKGLVSKVRGDDPGASKGGEEASGVHWVPLLGGGGRGGGALAILFVSLLDPLD